MTKVKLLYIILAIFTSTIISSCNSSNAVNTSDKAEVTSPEILRAFYLVEMSMLKSGRTTDNYCGKILKSLERAVDRDPQQATPHLEAAKNVEDKVTAFVKYVDDIKAKLESITGGRFEAGHPMYGQLKLREDISQSFNYMIKEGQGAELKNKINQLNSYLSAIISKLHMDPKLFLSLNQLEAKDNETSTWESDLFEHLPLAATIAILTKMQVDAKNAGAECLSEFAVYVNAR